VVIRNKGTRLLPKGCRKFELICVLETALKESLTVYNLCHWIIRRDPGEDGRIILKWIFKKWDVGAWTGSIWLGKGTSGGHL